MAFIPFENVARCTLNQQLAGQNVANVLYFLRTSAIDDAWLADLGNDLVNWYGGSLAGILSENIVLTDVTCMDMTTSFGSVIVTAGGGANGVISGPAVPLNTALVVTARTPKRGRSFRGRSYIVGLAASLATNEGNANSTATTDAVAHFNEMLTPANFHGAIPVVASRQESGIVRSIGVATAVVSYTCDSKFDSQRRRLPGRGT